MEPLRQPDEVYRCFAVERVSSALLSDVRLAARMRKGSTHVTALLRADNRSVRHYDNDSSARQRGTFESLSLRGAWGAFIWYALIPSESALCREIDALPVIRVGSIDRPYASL